MDDSLDLLEKLCLTPAISGREDRLRQVILDATPGLFDATRIDPMGSLLCLRKARPHSGSQSRGARKAAGADRPLRIMLAAHMDQIGFMVRHVDDAGFLRLQTVGGFDTRNLFARLVTVCTESGDLPGVLNPGGRPIHIATDEDKKKIPEISDLTVDLGLPAADVKKKVKIGDAVVLNAPFARIGRTVVGQAMDNRVACWIVIRAMQQLKNHDCEIHAVFTVQEEVGLRGAGTAAFDIRPDVALGVDTTLCVDTPGVPEDQRITRQGQGAGLTCMDAGSISDSGLLGEFEAVAKKKRIKTQRSILPRGSTDSAGMQRSAAGARVMTLSCPTRYIHTVTEMVHVDDLFACRDVLAAYLAQAG